MEFDVLNSDIVEMLIKAFKGGPPSNVTLSHVK